MKVYFYESAPGKSPITKYIDELPKSDQARFFEVIDEIESHGLSAVRVIFKPIEGKLWEIKFKGGNSSYRVFYCLIEKEIMVWLHAFSKKTQKTPTKEIEVAAKRMKEVLGHA